MAQKVTNDESKEKWCRHGRRYRASSTGTDAVVTAINRAESDYAATMCFGSGCMAWEWDKEGNESLRLEGDNRKGYCDAENGDGKIAIM